VLFSPIRSSPRPSDVSPVAVATWKTAETLDGRSYALPERCLVTSRYDPEAPRESHYALVCWSGNSLSMNEAELHLDISHLRNLLTDRPVGASQVTAVVRNCSPATERGTHRVALRARLAPPYLLRLRNAEQIKIAGGILNWAESVEARWRLQRSYAS